MKVTIKLETLRDAVARILQCHEFSAEHSLIVSNSLVEAEAKGVTSHGILRLQSYISDIKDGILIPGASPKVISSKGSVTVLDGKNCSGIIAGIFSADLTVNVAREHGVAFTVVRNIHHSGMLEYFTESISKSGLIGIAMCNAHPVVAPPGGKTGILGTNPISFSSTGNDERFSFDFAISESSFGKIRLAMKNREEILPSWAVDKEGRPTSKPGEAIDGALMPFGGYKGFGLGMIVDIMAGLLSGSAAGPDVITWNDKKKKWNNGMLIVAIDYSYFTSPFAFKTSLDKYIQNVRKKIPNNHIPGDRRNESYVISQSNGITISEEMLKEINELLFECKIDLKLVQQ